MIKKIFWILTLLLILILPQDICAEELDIKSSNAILIDAISGKVLYQKNADNKQFPASVTKIMTAYVALNKAKLSDILVASNNAIDGIDRGSSHIFLDYGEKLTLEQALYAMMLQSANDASMVIAENVGGSVENFVQLMNEQVKKWGLNNTHFANPHGLHQDNHYSSVYDMAQILRYCIANEDFVKISSAVNYEILPTNKNDESRILANGNKMIKKGEYFYEYNVLGKIGYTKQANYTYASYSKKGDTELIVVLFNSQDEGTRYSDALKLFEYGFEKYTNTKIKKENVTKSIDIVDDKNKVGTVTFSVDDDISILTEGQENSVTFEYEIVNEDSIDEINAQLIVKNNNEEIARYNMNKSVEEISRTNSWLKFGLSIFNIISVIVMLFFVIVFILGFIYSRPNKIKK